MVLWDNGPRQVEQVEKPRIHVVRLYTPNPKPHQQVQADNEQITLASIKLALTK